MLIVDHLHDQHASGRLDHKFGAPPDLSVQPVLRPDGTQGLFFSIDRPRLTARYPSLWWSNDSDVASPRGRRIGASTSNPTRPLASGATATPTRLAVGVLSLTFDIPAG
jgi:hypothetical protein